jgi:predicted alpha/beta hydrolase family esterase
MFLNDEENAKLSPYQVIKETKKKISSTNWKKYSERVLLIHTMNDKLIKFKNFKENSEILELKDENNMILKKGGHTLKKDELILLMSSLRFFNDII